MADTKATDIFATSQEQRFYRLQDFPTSASERREFIFMRTGHSAKPMDGRGWYLFNSALNKGFGMGRDARSLQVLSLMDMGLSGVQRFIGMPHMHELMADSTAAHTKQVMNIVQQICEKAFPDGMPKEVEAFRREALLAAWVHDMGEVVVELATANDMYALNPEKRAEAGAAKNALETELFSFALRLAEHAVDRAKPELFTETIAQMRADVMGVGDVMPRIALLREAMQHHADRLRLPREASAFELEMMRVYDKVENPSPGNFLHPFVKTLECVEGLRYLQRNSVKPAHVSLTYATSQEIVETARRSERRLSMMHAEALQPWQQKLAAQASAFTYRSLARQYVPGAEDYVSLAPEYIHRAPHPTMEVNAAHIAPGHLPQVRAQTQADFATVWAAQPSGNIDGTVWSRAQAGKVYRAAEQASLKPLGARFVPSSGSLVSMLDTPKMPELLKQVMRDMEPAASRDNVQKLRK